MKANTSRGHAVNGMVIGLFCSLLCWGELGLAQPEKASDWPQFLGPNRNGISTETGLLDAFPDNGPPEVWRTRIGGGMSGVAIAEGRLYTLTQKTGQQFVIALDAQTGKPVWETPVSDAYRNSMGDGPRATPTVSGERLFAFTGEGKLVALKTKDGKILWSHDVVKEQGSESPAEYGMACSPLVVEDLVIVTAGAREGTVVAYDTKTGQLKWTAGRDQPAGYSSPALLKVGGKPQVVVFYGTAAAGLDPKTGRALWRYAYNTDYNCNTATPIAHAGNVFLSAGENHGCVLLAPKPPEQNADNGQWTVSEVWTSLGPKSVMRNEWQTSLILGNHLFGFDNVGGAGPVTHLACLDLTTGERTWQKPRFGKGNFIAADGKLIISTIDGELVLVAADAEQFKELARVKLLGKTRQAPALADGRIYLRDDREIVCVDLRKNRK